MTIKLIVGLANPGSEYSTTRHNVGAWYVNLLADHLCSSLHKESKFFGHVSCINIVGSDVHLLIPTTFMNLSGKAVSAIANFYSIQPNEILVVHDELDLPPGTAKFKFGGGDNGHNGLKNIIKHFNDNHNFYRLRIGIGKLKNKNRIASFVLEKPTHCEYKLIINAIEEALYCTKIWFKEGIIKAINHLHAFKA